MNHYAFSSQHDEEVAKVIETTLAHKEQIMPNPNSLEGFATLLADAVPEADPAFRQQLQAKLLGKVALRQQRAPLFSHPSKARVAAFPLPLKMMSLSVAASLLLLLTLATFLTVPSLRVQAQEWVSFFTRAETDAITMEGLYSSSSEVDDASPTSNSAQPGNDTPASGSAPVVATTQVSGTAHMSDTDQTNGGEQAIHSGLSFADAERLAGFEVWTPTALPLGLAPEMFFYEPTEQAVKSLYYINSDAMLTRMLLVQQPVASVTEHDFFMVGASAVVTDILIGEIQGQFVQGNWCNSEFQTYESTGTVVLTADTQLNWCGDEDVWTLRWIESNYAFTLRVFGSPYDANTLNFEEIVQLAASLTPEVTSTNVQQLQ